MSFVLTPRKHLSVVKAKLRNKIPKLNERQLKRLQIPLQDALADEFYDMECLKGLEFFQKIIAMDNKRKESFKKKENQKLLQKIFNYLKEIDGIAQKAEIEVFLKMVDEMHNISNKFDWLIELLLVHASELVEKYDLENGEMDAVVKFIHATILCERFQWYRPAVILFESALQISTQHEDWMLKDTQLCALISQKLSCCLTKLSNETRKIEKDVESALLLSIRALKVLRKYFNADSINIEIEAEFEYASCFLDNESFENALNHFGHALELAETTKNIRKICEILVKTADCHKGLDDFEKFENYLVMAKKMVAVELKDVDFEGEIDLKLGKSFLQIHDYEKFMSYFKLSIECFIKSKNYFKVMQVKLIFADHKAKIPLNFNLLIDTILRSYKSNIGTNQELEKLLLWYERKYSLANRHHAFYHIDDEDHELKSFIEKYYDPDEIIKIQ